jgi:hypothetical protein
MTEQKLTELVNQAVALDQDIQALERKLAECKTLLIAEAKSRPEEQQPTDAGGTSWTHHGLDDCIARVSFPAPTLKSKIDGDGKSAERIKASAGRFFSRLFTPAVSFRPIERFREEAAGLLGKDAGKLIRLCESESKPRVSFETREAA